MATKQKQTKTAAIYCRVSTGEQTTDNQLRELRAVARRSGWKVVEVYTDQGISGAKGRDQRPAFDQRSAGFRLAFHEVFHYPPGTHPN